MNPEPDDTDLEAKLYDDIDEIAELSEQAIAADVAGHDSRRTDLLHEIYELARAWSDIDE